jgi:PLD-like domain/DnaJ domain
VRIQAYFSKIQEQLLTEIKNAESSILIAVAWFTDLEIFGEIVSKANQGLQVELITIDDEINSNSSVDFNDLVIAGGKLWLIKSNINQRTLMHNKFCVIDFKNVITGSHNWSYQAQKNNENITISYDDLVLANQFRLEFNRIKKYYFNIDFDTRSNSLKDLLLYSDFELSELNCEIKALEIQISALHNVKAEIEKGIYDFELMYNLELGDLLLKLLDLKRLKTRNDKKSEKDINEADEKYKKFEEAFNDSKGVNQLEIGDEEKIILKEKYRKASKLCHPDLISEEYKSEAEEIFKELQNAYELNDLDAVTKILSHLENGQFQFNSQIISKEGKLKNILNKFILKRKLLEDEILRLKKSEIYQLIEEIKDFPSYFETIKKELKREINSLRNG